VCVCGACVGFICEGACVCVCGACECVCGVSVCARGSFVWGVCGERAGGVHVCECVSCEHGVNACVASACV